MNVTIPEMEVQARCLGQPTVVQAAKTFLERGIVLLENAFRRDYIDKLQTAFDKYASRSPEELEKSCLKVGDKRFMISVKVETPFNDPDIYASPMLLPILQTLLGKHCVLDSFGAVCALPGSRMQHVHLDHSPLFEADEISTRLPPHAVTVVIPLIDIDLHCGTTAVWEGTHRMVGARQLKDRLNRSPDLPGASFPTPKMGGCYLMDYRLVHGGTPNNSDRPRTILYLVYSRPWFRDAANFGGQPAVLIEQTDLGKIPDQFRSLFRFVVPR